MGADTLVPAELRRPASAVVLTAALVLAILAVRYARGVSPRWLDVRIESAVDSVVPTHYRPLAPLLYSGNLWLAVAIAAVLSAIAQMLGRHRLAILAIGGPSLTGVAIYAMKPLVGRILNGDYAYPSGHTAAATAFGLLAAMLLVSVLHLESWGAGLVLSAGALLSGGAMALALIVYQWHYATDTVGGFCTAVVVVLGSALLGDRAPRRRAGET